MSNAIEACKHAESKLLFFDNVYMYGKGQRSDDRGDAL